MIVPPENSVATMILATTTTSIVATAPELPNEAKKSALEIPAELLAGFSSAST